MLPGARLLARSAAPRTGQREVRHQLAIAGSLLACLAIAGCSAAEPSPSTQPVDTDRRRPGARPVITAEERQQSSEGRFGPKQPPPPDPYDKPKGDTGAIAEAVAAAAEEKPRDYPAELLSAVRGAESCVQPRIASAAVPTELLISLEALVLESGTIVSGKAHGAVLTPEELECVKRRLESTRLPDKVKDAPRRVSATLKLTFKPQEPNPAAAGGAPAANPAPQPPAAPTPPAAAPTPSAY